MIQGSQSVHKDTQVMGKRVVLPHVYALPQDKSGHVETFCLTIV